MKIPSLRTTLMLLFFIFFFAPYGLLAFFSVSMSRGMLQKGTIDHLKNLVEVKETAIEQWLKERVSDGRYIAESKEIKSLEPKRIESFLSVIKYFERSYLEIQVYDLKGQHVTGTPLKTSYEKGEWFQTALTGETFISRPQLEPISSRPTVTISFAIKNAEDRPIGVLKEVVDVTFISELISESKLGKTGQLFITSPQGEIVLHKRTTDFLKKETAKVPYFEKGRPEPVYTGVYQDYTGNEVLGSWRWVQSLRCYLIAEQNTKEAFYEIDLLVEKAVFIFFISTLLILGISYVVIGRVTDPIKRLSERVALFAEGHFEKPVSTNRADEIGKLISGFNAMAEKLKKAHAELEGKVDASNKELVVAYQMLKQRQEQLVQSEKMAALGELSAGIAHEIRNPLTSIKIFIQSLGKEMNLNENQKEDFRIILREIDRINDNIIRFLNFARPEEPQFQTIHIGSLVKDTVNFMSAKFKSSGILLDLFTPKDDPPVEGDPKQLAQVLLNLLLNAVEAMPEGGRLTIRPAVKEDADSRQTFLQLVIRDTGHGIPEKDRPYLFDPFFTTKARGTGLGLSIVYSIVQKHGGRIEVESEPGKGSSFILSLPVQTKGDGNESGVS